MLVSVLTPSFNQAAWLADNLRSVGQQEYPQVEHIVMDGGSTDGSLEILMNAQPAVRWRSEPDGGQSDAINKAFRESTGQIIGWLNSDDAYFDRKAIAEAVAIFERDPSVDVVYGHAALVNADGLVLQIMWAPPFNRQLLRLQNYIVQPAAFIRRSALSDRLIDQAYDYTMDRELWLRLSRSHSFRRLNKILAIDRHHFGRKSYTRLDLEKVDTARLIATYGVCRPSRTRLPLKVLKIANRLIGVSMMGEALRNPGVFGGSIDGGWRLFLRQVATRRSSMPSGMKATASARSGL